MKTRPFQRSNESHDTDEFCFIQQPLILLAEIFLSRHERSVHAKKKKRSLCIYCFLKYKKEIKLRGGTGCLSTCRHGNREWVCYK